MKIQIRLVGFLAESGLSSGFRGGELEVEEGTTLDQVLARLQVVHGNAWLVTVNRAFVSANRQLEDGDVVSLVPRIGGG